MLSSLWVTGSGAGLITLFIVFHWLGIFAKTRAVFAFLGVCLLGAGLVSRVLTWAATAIAGIGNWASQVLFGVSGGAALIAVVLLVIFVHDLHPKHSAGKRTSFIGIALAALLVAGVSGIATLNSIPGAAQNGVNTAKTTLGG
jgi:hypothetical protein